MANKLYVKEDKNKIIIRLIILFIILILTFVEFPYFISAPGELINLDKKIQIDGEYKSKGSINMTYVTEYKSNAFMLLYALINPYIDITKESEYLATNDNREDLEFREKLELQEAIASSIIYGYQKAEKNVIINKEEIYVTYILPEADTNLKVGDIIKKIDNESVGSRKELNEIIASKELNQRFEIEVINNGNTYIRYASKSLIKDSEIIGIYPTIKYDYTVEPNIKFKTNSNESGPSGGFMSTLEIYNELTSNDITKGYIIAGTGTIDIDGVVGPISGVKYKLRGAAKNKADIFLVPAGENYEEAISEKEKYNYKIEIISIENFDDALLYLNSLTNKK